MSFKQVFNNPTVYYFFHKELVKRNPELNKRLIFCEDLNYEQLIRKYRGFANKDNAEEFYKSKLPIYGYTRSIFKRFQGYGQRNVFNVTLTPKDIQSLGVEFQEFFQVNPTTIISLQAAYVETEYKFILLNSDIDIIDQYEQAYLNKAFLSDIESFTLFGDEIGLGKDFDLPYTLTWNDLEELKINLDGMAYNGISGSCMMSGLILFSNNIPQYMIEKINVNVWEKTQMVLLEHFSVPDENTKIL